MNTFEMYNLAQNNSKTYECKYGTYDKKNGFDFKTDVPGYSNCDVFANVLVAELDWKIKQEPRKDMTLEDIEKALGYKINLVHNKEPKPERSKNYEDLLRTIFDL